jgi:phosphoribosylformimino-5-aminoimidazole carboxamide ribonucleotide (ProFAR) isomerase
MNMPKLVAFLHECGIENPIVCSSINKAGYFMNPDIESYEKTIKEGKFRPIAMSVLASGAVQPKEAIEYVCKNLGIKSVVFGASSTKNIIETKNLIESFCCTAAA